MVYGHRVSYDRCKRQVQLEASATGPDPDLAKERTYRYFVCKFVLPSVQYPTMLSLGHENDACRIARGEAIFRLGTSEFVIQQQASGADWVVPAFFVELLQAAMYDVSQDISVIGGIVFRPSPC